MHQYAAFESVNSLLDWCKDQADLTQATISEIRSFFYSGPGESIRALSVPICMAVPAEALPLETFGALPKVSEDKRRRIDCLAVLNVHSHSDRILGGTGYAMFVPIIEPFCRLLAHLLVLYGSATWHTDQQPTAPTDEKGNLADLRTDEHPGKPATI